MKTKTIALLLLLCLASVASFAGDIKGNGIMQSDLYLFLRNTQKAVMNQVVSASAIAQAASPNSKNVSFGAFQYTVDGIWYARAASTNYTLAAPDATLPTQSYSAGAITRNYLFSLNSSGTVTVDVGTATALPAVPDNFTPFGKVVIALSSGGAFRVGQTNFDATSVNATFTSIRVPNSGTNKVKLTSLY